MAQVLYYLLLKPLSLLPMGLLYRLSDCLFFLMFYVVGYRKKVVFTNLQNSFPEKSPKEHKDIARKFYQHLCDLIVESIKIFSISEKEALKRFKIHNPEALQPYYDAGQSVIFVMGHYGSWELAASAVGLSIEHIPAGIYQPIKNKFFDQKIRESRCKRRTEVIHRKKVTETFEENERINKLMAVFFIADQAPRSSKKAHWVEFLNQDTAYAFGGDYYARKFDQPVFYGKIWKPKRGHYEAEFVHLIDHANEKPPGWVIDEYSKRLEVQIREKPEHWLWTHKRWKRKRTDNN